MRGDDPIPKPADANANERIREAANTLFVRWLFGPPGLHIRDYADKLTIKAAVNGPTCNEDSDHGKTSLVSPA